MSFLRRSRSACSGSVLTERLVNCVTQLEKPVSASVLLSLFGCTESGSLVLPLLLLVPHVRFHTSVIAHSLHLCLIDSPAFVSTSTRLSSVISLHLACSHVFFALLLVLLLLIWLQPIWIWLHVLDRTLVLILQTILYINMNLSWGCFVELEKCKF